MSIYESVYPENRFPCKDQIEHMLRVAIKGGVQFTSEDIEKFGYVENGMYIGNTKSLDQLRKQVPKLWDRMTTLQKADFLMVYLINGTKYINEIVKSLGDLGMKTEDAQKAIDTLSDNIFKEYTRIRKADKSV